MTNEASDESDCQSLNDREIELDLLQRRLHNKTQRAAQVIQFNIVALSLVAGIVQFARSPDVELNVMIIAGGAIMLVSIFLSVVGISLNGASLSWPQGGPSDQPNADSLIAEYRSRNQHLGLIMPTALGAGGFGAAIILIGAFRVVGIEPVVPWWVSGPAVFLFLVGGTALGYRLA